MLILTVFLSLPCMAADAVRLKCVWVDGGITTTNHGTATVLDGAIVTAAHNVESGRVSIETAEGWVQCRVQKSDVDADLALLKPERPVRHGGARKDGCYGSVRGLPVQCLRLKVSGMVSAEIPGFDHGASGSPLIVNGAFHGICTDYVKNSEPLRVIFVPAVVVMAFIGGK